MAGFFDVRGGLEYGWDSLDDLFRGLIWFPDGGGRVTIEDIFGPEYPDYGVGTAPFVPTQTPPAPVDTTPVQIDPNWNQGYDVATEPGVDLGNEGVPASDVVTGGLDSPLEGDNNEIGINLLLSSLGLTGAATGLMSVLAGQDRRPTRTTEAVFADLPEFTKLTPTLLSPLYRS